MVGQEAGLEDLDLSGISMIYIVWRVGCTDLLLIDYTDLLIAFFSCSST
jgi:hypothetical protein